MHKNILIFALAGPLALSACDDMSGREQMLFGGLLGATFGVITAEALDADPDWIIIGALAGATVGMLVARNDKTKRCAYAKGDRTYRVRRCR